MKAFDLIKEAEEYAAEWIEMSDRPHEIISIVLANKILALQNNVTFLERALKNERTRKTYHK